MTHSRGLRRAGTLLSSSLLLLTATSPFLQPAHAEVLVRAQGRCKLISGGFNAFNGHCQFKHKRAGSTDAYVVKLDDGTDFIFRGPSADALQVQTYRGIVNVRHREAQDHEVFIWNDGEKRRLSVKLDHVQNPAATFDDGSNRATVAAIAGGAAAVALIGALISGKNNNSTSERSSIGAPVSELQSLVGAKAAGGERQMAIKGYSYRGGSQGADSVFTFYQQPRTANCVGVETSDGRYRNIVYTDSSNCS